MPVQFSSVQFLSFALYAPLYTVSGKKESTLFLNNFKKFKLTFIIFGTHYHYNTLIKTSKTYLQNLLLATYS